MPDYVTTDAEPDTPDHLEEGVTLTMSLPLRGNIQVRVEEATPRRITLCTLEGHPLTGAVRFLAEERGDRVRFEVQVYDRPATLIDHLMMRPLGEMLQASTWEQLVERVIDMSAGRAANRVEHDEEVLDDRQAELIDEWLRDLIMTQRRQAAAPPGEAADVSAEIPISERTARELRPEA
jgi:NADH dehydrogenase